ncbi:MAG: phosphoribosylformylglycinamidine synthase subunit PurL [Alphaproteobacteria bacterium]|nr:phosphoribosylformylglycinamidine synthase subunit PurL [Alphaproteobacteria bacterium]
MTIANTAITPEIVAEHGLTPDEYDRVLDIMGREPTLTELGIFSVMWSEHCSYKSSRVWLKKFPTERPWVIQGPGENAGVIDIGDGLAAIFKIESHNHPSFIEPYQGAATGVGGILRDVFTMGARPIANLNALRFGAPDHPKTKHLVSGVVAGIGGYGNCVGVPTVAGETEFDPAYNGNILVNAMTVGLARADRIFYAKAAGIGNPVVYVGAKTGRDGIHGATMASAEFNEDSEEKRPTVQVGDPFTEKLLIEACLELMAEDAIVAIQDMGAAGLTSSSVEMSDKGGTGIDLDLDKVPVREEGMTAYEIMLSESQERMLMVLKPEATEKARAIMEKWELDYAEIGFVTDTGRLRLSKDGEIKADIPVQPLVSQSPVYDRPYLPTPPRAVLAPEETTAPGDLMQALVRLMGGPNLSSRRWIWEQYDHLIMGDTAIRPGGDASVVRVRDTDKALALSVDCTPRYCYADPVQGGRQAVAECWRNITATGAQPLAMTDNLNFGNPERPEIMGQFAGCVVGMAEACDVLDFPVIGGNVSLYNETAGQAILPTPVVGGVGVLDDIEKRVPIAYGAEGLTLIEIGANTGWLGSSRYLRDIEGEDKGAPPPVDLALERKTGDAVRGLIADGLIEACHDISDGGVLVAVTEMALASRIGADIAPDAALPLHAWAFGEDQARYVVATNAPDTVIERLAALDIPATSLGKTGGTTLTVGSGMTISLDSVAEAHEGFFPTLMGE